MRSCFRGPCFCVLHVPIAANVLSKIKRLWGSYNSCFVLVISETCAARLEFMKQQNTPRKKRRQIKGRTEINGISSYLSFFFGWATRTNKQTYSVQPQLHDSMKQTFFSICVLPWMDKKYGWSSIFYNQMQPLWILKVRFDGTILCFGILLNGAPYFLVLHIFKFKHGSFNTFPVTNLIELTILHFPFQCIVHPPGHHLQWSVYLNFQRYMLRTGPKTYC